MRGKILTRGIIRTPRFDRVVIAKVSRTVEGQSQQIMAAKIDNPAISVFLEVSINFQIRPMSLSISKTAKSKTSTAPKGGKTL
jgi:hypothetical protein